jgi:hypothetical protein
MSGRGRVWLNQRGSITMRAPCSSPHDEWFRSSTQCAAAAMCEPSGGGATFAPVNCAHAVLGAASGVGP